MMSNMKWTALFAAGAIFCGGAFAADEKPAEAPKADAPKVEAPVDIFGAIPAVVAEIKGEKITKDILVADIMKMFPDGKVPEQITAENLKMALPGIVKSMVVKKLFDAELAKSDIKPSAELVKQKLDEELKKMSAEERNLITQQLQMMGKTPEQWIDEMSKETMAQEQIAAQIYLEKNVYQNIKVDKNVTPEEVKKFYDENKDKFKETADKPDQLRASHILIAVDTTGDAKAKAESDKQALAKAKELIEKIQKNPALFEELAKENSTCPSKENGGSLGAFEKGQMVPEFETATLALKDNELTKDPVKTQFGYHIIRRDPLKTEEVTLPFDQVRSNIEAFLKEQKMQEEAQAQVKVRDEFFKKLEQDYQVKYFIEMPADIAE